MATAVLPNTEILTANRIDIDDRHGWGFALLLATTATLFVRPADLVPALDDWPIYQVMILACLVVSLRTLTRQLTQVQLRRQPVTACLFVLLLAIGLSHLSHGFVWGARTSMLEFCKPLLLYLLMIGLINTPWRLLVFAKTLVITIAVVAGLALLDRNGLISIAALEPIRDHGLNETNGEILIDRIRGTGIFHDPNDFGLILVAGLVLSLSFLFRPNRGWQRYVWLVPTIVLLTTFGLTHSRGAFVSLACVLPAILAFRSGPKIAAVSLLMLPVLAMVVSSRMTDLSAINDGTGQSRIQIWSDSLSVWREFPIFGLGEGMLVDEIGVAAHNSFIHCFAELGCFGGIAFASCFLAAGLGLWVLREHKDRRSVLKAVSTQTRDVAHLRIFVFALLAAYAAGILTLSRQFVMPTYLVLGLATATQNVTNVGQPRWRSDGRFAAIAVVVSIGLLFAFYLTVRILVRW